MVLSDRTIKEMGDSLVSPFKIENVSASSIDLTLADDFIDNKGIRHHLSDGCKSFPILANEFWLMSTNETVKVPKDCVGIVKGKSSLARKGIMIECAGVCDAGWSGQVTLEVKNLNPDVDISVAPGQKICQIVFIKMDKLAEIPYSTESGHHYQDQKGTTRAWDIDVKEGLTTKQEDSFLGKKVDSIFNDLEKVQTAIECLQFDVDFLGAAYNLSEHEDLLQTSECVKAGLMDSHDKITFAMDCMKKLESKLYEKGWLHKNGGENDGC